MTYYDELISDIEKHFSDHDYFGAYGLIINELKMPYIPKEAEKRLLELKEKVEEELSVTTSSLSDEQIQQYLNGSKQQQLLAVAELHRLNLNDYCDVIEAYLRGPGFVNAKVLLIESLINQGLTREFECNKDGLTYKFIPRYLLTPEESDGFIEAYELLKEAFIHNPAYLKLAKELLYKECLFALPVNYEADESKLLCDRIVEFICKSFNDEDSWQDYQRL